MRRTKQNEAKIKWSFVHRLWHFYNVTEENWRKGRIFKDPDFSLESDCQLSLMKSTTTVLRRYQWLLVLRNSEGQRSFCTLNRMLLRSTSSSCRSSLLFRSTLFFSASWIQWESFPRPAPNSTKHRPLLRRPSSSRWPKIEAWRHLQGQTGLCEACENSWYKPRNISPSTPITASQRCAPVYEVQHDGTFI